MCVLFWDGLRVKARSEVNRKKRRIYLKNETVCFIFWRIICDDFKLQDFTLRSSLQINFNFHLDRYPPTVKEVQLNVMSCGLFYSLNS